MSKAKMERRDLPKRFYAAANVAACEGGFCIQLDGKPVRTPQQKLLHCSSQRLAQQIAKEWQAQTDVIDTDMMPLTRLLNIALDRAPIDRAAWLEELARYGETDLLFYRAPCGGDALITDAAAEELAALQHLHFTPVLEWIATKYGMRFVTTEGIMPVPQPRDSLQQLHQLYEAASDHELAALALTVPILGSALLTLGLWKGRLSTDEALFAAQLDEDVQARFWGKDGETAAQWASKARDVKAAAFFLTCK